MKSIDKGSVAETQLVLYISLSTGLTNGLSFKDLISTVVGVERGLERLLHQRNK